MISQLPVKARHQPMARRYLFCLLSALTVPLAATEAGAQEAKFGPLLHDALGAPDELIISGSVRARYEALEGQARAGFGASDQLFSLRTTLLAEYRADGLRIGAELYDSRAYGSEPGSAIGTGEVNTFEFVQAYVGGELTCSPDCYQSEVDSGSLMMVD